MVQVDAFSPKNTIVITGDPSVYYVDGQINHDSFDRFLEAVTNNKKLKTIVLNSYGGYVLYAQLMMGIIRVYHLDTRVDPGMKCMSACVLLFQGGVHRIASDDATFMLHPVKVQVEKHWVRNVIATNKFYAWLIRYGFHPGAADRVRKNKEVYFGAQAALDYGLATEIRGKFRKK